MMRTMHRANPQTIRPYGRLKLIGAPTTKLAVVSPGQFWLSGCLRSRRQTHHRKARMTASASNTVSMYPHKKKIDSYRVPKRIHLIRATNHFPKPVSSSQPTNIHYARKVQNQPLIADYLVIPRVSRRKSSIEWKRRHKEIRNLYRHCDNERNFGGLHLANSI